MKEFLREATKEDADLLFRWANDPVVRQSSFCTKQITYQEHLNWFEQLMNDSARKQYIYMCGDDPVGQVRIAIAGKEAEIGYSIAPDQRGKGYSVRMLQKLRERVAEEYPEIEKLIARVKPENVASGKAVTGAGFTEVYREYELVISESKRQN